MNDAGGNTLEVEWFVPDYYGTRYAVHVRG